MDGGKAEAGGWVRLHPERVAVREGVWMEGRWRREAGGGYTLRGWQLEMGCGWREGGGGRLGEATP